MSDVDLTNPPFKLPVKFTAEPKPFTFKIDDADGERLFCADEDHTAYIVAAVNSAPGLVAEVARLRALVDAQAERIAAQAEVLGRRAELNKPTA